MNLFFRNGIIRAILLFLCCLLFPIIGNCNEDSTGSKYTMKKMKENALSDYALERGSLSNDQIDDILDKGMELLSQTDLVTSLSNSGSALFPHTYISKCGDQIAAVAQACLAACEATGKQQILLIGVLHSLTDNLTEARKKEMSGVDILQDKCRGIFGPGLPNEEIFSKEFSLDNFMFLLEHAARKNGKKVPNVVIRYPNLIYGQPENLPGIEELKKQLAESIVVATSDLCHQGTAYGLEKDKTFSISQEGYDFAQYVIENNLRLLSEDNLLSYRQYCIDTLSDSLEVGQLLNYLLGPLEGYIRNLRLVEVSDLFEENPEPSWVAATLVELKPGLSVSSNK